MVSRGPAIPFAIACLGIAIFCCMDALMKGLGLALGAYSALLWRTAAGVVVMVMRYQTKRVGLGSGQFSTRRVRVPVEAQAAYIQPRQRLFR